MIFIESKVSQLELCPQFAIDVAMVSEADLKERKKPRNVVLFHPDLGIGGAERLIIDAAVGLQELGHKVIIFTSHCDPQHCFEEARDGTFQHSIRSVAV